MNFHGVTLSPLAELANPEEEDPAGIEGKDGMADGIVGIKGITGRGGNLGRGGNVGSENAGVLRKPPIGGWKDGIGNVGDIGLGIDAGGFWSSGATGKLG